MYGTIAVGGVRIRPSGETDMTADEADRAASFAEFFDAQRRPALRLAYVLTGNAGEAEDVVAEAFARVYPHWMKGQVKEPNAYVRRTVINVVNGRFRRLATRRRHDERVRLGEPSVAFGDDRIMQRATLEAALAALPPRQRAAVVLRVIEDMSEAETARVLGVSVGTVKGYLSRGLERLRAELGDEAPV